jgi:hypothetical protein
MNQVEVEVVYRPMALSPRVAAVAAYVQAIDPAITLCTDMLETLIFLSLRGYTVDVPYGTYEQQCPLEEYCARFVRPRIGALQAGAEENGA